jgi:hypothetical protein
MIAQYAIRYSMTVDGCWPLRLKAVVANANATMASANAVISSSVDLRVTPVSSDGWLPRAGDGIVMLLTRPPSMSGTSSWPWTSQ